MKKRIKIYMILFFILYTFTACSHSKSEEVSLTVSAAASMQEALTQVKEMYETNHKDVTIYFNFGSSGALKQQITQGAPVDLFFSASKDQFDELVKNGHISKEDSVDLIGNELVLIQNKNKDSLKLKDISGLTNNSISKIAIGTPETVPAGEYTKETLENLQLWDNLKNKMVFAKDVRQVLTYVETGNVDAGFVYKTDALISKKVEITGVAQAGDHSAIIYPLGVIKNSKQKEEAKSFYKFLQSDQALKIFQEYGFHTLKK
ncbi:molybdate ABC transporter substrate-binding protein [Neobacillus sp. D3-1R]|uniref:molybdate ABC transporter substrate-binding protein n=1 Tax=Neobacillus sp. D3-1R TaxID=3445778 RepID=UPI003FA0356A